MKYERNTPLIQITATDLSGISHYPLNDTRFNITSSSYLENIVDLEVQVYYVNISVNDTFNNINSQIIWINMTESGLNSTPPALEIISPASSTFTNSTIMINISSSDSIMIDSIWYNYEGYNISYLSEFFNDFPDGTYTIYAWANDTSGNINSNNVTFTVDTEDTDNDGLPDSLDKFYYDVSNVTTTGITNLNITVGGNSTSGLYYGRDYEINFYDGASLLINFTNNFTYSELDLSKVTIIKATNSIIVNLSGQLQSDYNKTLYIEDNNFASLCVKDVEVASIS